MHRKEVVNTTTLWQASQDMGALLKGVIKDYSTPRVNITTAEGRYEHYKYPVTANQVQVMEREIIFSKLCRIILGMQRRGNWKLSSLFNSNPLTVIEN